jgi:acetyl-CoA acetyltransferase
MIDDRQMRDATCIVGVGTSHYGSFPETDDYGLGVEALKVALADAGLSDSDVTFVLLQHADGKITGAVGEALPAGSGRDACLSATFNPAA